MVDLRKSVSNTQRTIISYKEYLELKKEKERLQRKCEELFNKIPELKGNKI